MTPDKETTDSAKAKLERRPHAPTVIVTLTEPNIVLSEQRNSSHCMWAEAVKEAVPSAQNVTVDLQTIRFTDPAKGLRYVYLTPRKAQVSLIRFDQGLHTEAGLSIKLRDGQVVKAKAYMKRSRPGKGQGRMPEGHKAELKTYRGEASTVVGGTPPPMGPLPNPGYRGKRRSFGLRALEF